MVKKTLFSKLFIFSAVLSIFSYNLVGQGSIVFEAEITKKDQKSQNFGLKQKFQNIFKWCRENQGKALLISGSIIVTAAGISFLIYKNSKNQIQPAIDINFDQNLLDHPNPNDGKLPNGIKNPARKIINHNGCTICITQLPGLVQTRCDCGYYALFALAQLANNNETELSNRTLYRKCEIEWKNELSKDDYKDYRAENLTWINNQGMKGLVNKTASLKNLKNYMTKNMFLFWAGHWKHQI